MIHKLPYKNNTRLRFPVYDQDGNRPDLAGATAVLYVAKIGQQEDAVSIAATVDAVEKEVVYKIRDPAEIWHAGKGHYMVNVEVTMANSDKFEYQNIKFVIS